MHAYLYWQQAQLASAFPSILWEGAPPAGKAALPHYLPLAALTAHSLEPRPAPAGCQRHWVTLKLHFMAAATNSHAAPVTATDCTLQALLQWLHTHAAETATPDFVLGQLVVGSVETHPAPAGAFACVLTLHRLVQTPLPAAS